MKKIIILFFVLHSCFSYSQCLKILMEDLAKNSKEFKAIVNENSGFKAWQVLAEHASSLRTDINELNLVSKNLEAIEKAGGYTKWKGLQKAAKVWRTAKEMQDDVINWATNYRKILPSNSQLAEFNKACAASYKKSDGTIETVFGRNGGVLNNERSFKTISAEKNIPLQKELADKLPTDTKWPNVANCAECDAVNQALYNGAKWDDIQIHTININKQGKMTDVIQCSECQNIFDGMYVTSQ